MNKLIYTQDRFSRRLGVLAGKMRRFTCLLTMAALLTLALSPVVRAADTDASVDADSDAKDMKGVAAPVVEQPALGSKITGLLQFEFSDKYYTPRGLESSNSGISFQPLLILFFDLYSSDKGPLTDLSFNLGVWNDVDSHANPSEKNPSNWNEIDGFFGVEAKLFKDWKVDTTETFFKSQTNSYSTTTNLDFQVTYMDHWFADKSFSINPYFGFFYDTSKIPVVLGAPNQYYGTIGMDPTYKFKSIPLTLELPSFVNIVSDNFYEQFNGAAGGAGAAVISTELKATTPLTFIPISYGAWSAYAGVQYYHLDNPGLEDGNRILKNNAGGTGPADTNLYQFHFGMTCFF